MAVITLTSSALTGSPVRVLCSSVTVGLKKNLSNKPIENGTNLAEINTLSFNNPTYTLNNVKITGASGTLTFKNMLELLKLNYDGTNAPTLTITYGPSTTLEHMEADNNLAITAEAIPVILDAGSIVISAEDSRNGYLPMASLTFIETK